MRSRTSAKNYSTVPGWQSRSSGERGNLYARGNKDVKRKFDEKERSFGSIRSLRMTILVG